MDFNNIKLFSDSYRNDFINVYINCLKSRVDEVYRSEYCINHITLADLLILKERRVNQIIATRANCSNCAYLKNSKLFDEILEEFNKIIEEKNIPNLAIQWIDESSWMTMYKANCQDEQSQDSKNDKQSERAEFSRRNFFRKFVMKD